MRNKIALVGLAALLCGCKPDVSKRETVKVVTLSYKGEETSTGIGPAIGGNGGVAITTSTSAEEYNVIVDCPTHGRRIIESKRLFQTANPGDVVKVQYEEFWYGTYHTPIFGR